MDDDFDVVRSRGLRRRLEMMKNMQDDDDEDADADVIDSYLEEEAGDKDSPARYEQASPHDESDDLETVQDWPDEQEEQERSDADYCKDEEERIVSEVGEEAARKIHIIVSVALIAIFTVFALIGFFGVRRQQTQIKEALPYVRFEQKQVQADGDTFTDKMTIKKYIEMEDGCLLLILAGTPENFKQPVRVSVSSSVYNMVKNGDVAKISYRVIKVAEKGKQVDKAVDLKIKSVQEGL